MADLTGPLQEREIRPQELMAEQAELYAADVARLLERRAEFVDVACPACDGPSSSPALSKYELDFVECTECGTIYMTPRPAPEILDDYYANSQNYEFWSRVVFPASEDARRERIFRPRAEQIVEIARRHGAVGTIVDVGAGFGTFCEEVARAGHFRRVVAIEPEPHLAAACRERGIEVIEAPVERAELDYDCDVITSFEVIEHLFAPVELIRLCRRKLSPQGLLVLTCPNGKGFDVMELGALSSVVDTEHLNLFNPDSLSGLLEREGFTTLEVHTPGRLDAELVRNRVLAGEHDLSSPFLERVLIDEWERLGGPFQDFLASHGLSSNQWIVARRDD